MTSSYGRLTLPDDQDDPIILDLRDSALEFAVCTRAAIARLPDLWCNAGVYILVGGVDADGRTQVYVGKASRLRDRLKDHVKNKPWWNRAILLQSKSREGFTTADAAWMEGDVIQRLLGWESVALENRAEPSDLSLSEHEVQWLDGVVSALFRVFRLLGHSEISERLVGPAGADLENGKPDVWLVRAGTGGNLASSFKARNEIRVSFSGTYSETLAGVDIDTLRATGGSGSAIGQLLRFRDGIQVGDYVVTPLPGSATYLVGRVSGLYRFDPIEPEFRHVRDVFWLGEISGDVMTEDLRRSLGSILTLFHPSDQAQLLALVGQL